MKEIDTNPVATKRGTPRTDANLIDQEATGNMMIKPDFARQLERELNTWQTMAERLSEELRFLLEPEYLCSLSSNEDSELCLVASAHKSAEKTLAAYESAKSGNLPDPRAGL